MDGEDQFCWSLTNECRIFRTLEPFLDSKSQIQVISVLTIYSNLICFSDNNLNEMARSECL